MKPNWEGETCACCTREQRLVWSISDDTWNMVVADYYKNKTLCLECFLRQADDRGLPEQLVYNSITFQDIVFSDREAL